MSTPTASERPATGHTGRAVVLGVMGWPVGHSRSPAMHTAAIRAAGLDAVYVALAVPPERVGEAVRGLRALGFRGCNVTIPHKEAVIPFLDELTPAAHGIGAVNTILVEPDGRLVGDNTDALGAFDALAAAGAPPPAGATVLVLGAGGAARAAAWGAASRGASRVVILNRTVGRAGALAGDLAGQFPDCRFEARGLDDPGDLSAVALVLQMTSLGMKPGDALPVDPALLPAGAWVLEAVYAPLETPLLAACRARGLATVDGLGMLVGQGARSFALWTGVEPDRGEMRRALGLD